jgi:LysR family glycine cleavage system transcriptional activator
MYRRSRNDVIFTNETHAIQAAVAGQRTALARSTLIADELAIGIPTVPFRPALGGGITAT